MSDSFKSQSNSTPLKADALEYLASLAGEVGLSPNTIAAYSHDLETAALFFTRRGISSWARIGTQDVVAFLGQGREGGLAGATLARRLASLRGFFRHWMAANGTLDKDPTRFPGSTRLWNRLPHILSPTQALELMDAPSGGGWKPLRDRALLALLAEDEKPPREVGVLKGARDLVRSAPGLF